MNYTLVINGKPQGPYTLAQLKELKIRPGDFVRTEAMDDYKEAHEIDELRQLFGFKKQVLIQYYGSFDERLTAAVLDWFFVSGVCIIIAFVVSLFITNMVIGLAFAFSLLIVIPVVKFIYQIIMESSPKQATYGKQLAGLTVCDMQGSRLTPAHAAGRNAAKIFSVFTLFMGYLYCYFNKQQQCLHDKIAATLVIKDRL